MKITMQVSTQDLLDLDMTQDALCFAVSEHMHASINDRDGGYVYLSAVAVEIVVNDDSFDPASNWTVHEALAKITQQPDPQAALVAVVSANIGMDELGFASDLLSEYGTTLYA
jgi:hypothetical protein